MTLKEATLDSNRARLPYWENNRWITLAEGVDFVPTKDVWNKHTREQSKKYGGLKLAPYFIEMNENVVRYGLSHLFTHELCSNDWEII